MQQSTHITSKNRNWKLKLERQWAGQAWTKEGKCLAQKWTLATQFCGPNEEQEPKQSKPTSRRNTAGLTGGWDRRAPSRDRNDEARKTRSKTSSGQWTQREKTWPSILERWAQRPNRKNHWAPEDSTSWWTGLVPGMATKDLGTVARRQRQVKRSIGRTKTGSSCGWNQAWRKNWEQISQEEIPRRTHALRSEWRKPNPDPVKKWSAQAAIQIQQDLR
jgi:hypothetical protein